MVENDTDEMPLNPGPLEGTGENANRTQEPETGEKLTESEWITKWSQESEEPVWICEELLIMGPRNDTAILDSGATSSVVGKEWLER